VLAENTFGCRGDTMLLSISIGPTAIIEAPPSKLVLYPNPAHHSITVENLRHPSVYTILDLYGKTPKKGFVDASSNRIDLSLLQQGMYFLQIENAGVYKILKK
jgi:hypothetical protein